MRGTLWWVSCPLFILVFKAMQSLSIAERIDKIAAGAAKENGVDLVYSEIVGGRRNMIVRIYIDKPEGVTIEDCSIVSHAVEAVIDADDFIPSPYVLEISSPGLERPLFSIGDFERYTGKKANVKTADPVDGQANFNGRIAAVEGSEIVFDDKTKGTVRLPFETISKANLRVDLTEEFKKKR